MLFVAAYPRLAGLQALQILLPLPPLSHRNPGIADACQLSVGPEDSKSGPDPSVTGVLPTGTSSQSSLASVGFKIK